MAGAPDAETRGGPAIAPEPLAPPVRPARRPSDRPKAVGLRRDQRPPGHLRGLVDPQQGQRGRRDVGEDAACVELDARSTVAISGTGLVVWAVFGEPSALSMWSALPWSAVIRQAPPRACTAATTRARQPSTVSIAFDRGRDVAGVADHVGVGEVDDPEAEALARGLDQASQKASAAAAALISGLWS